MVKQTTEQELVVIDATGLLVGRIATQAARLALHGKRVRIVHTELAAISGRKRATIEEWTHRFTMGVPKKGPFQHRYPDRLLRRMIRGMLPYKFPRGREAYKNILCYIGVPTELKDAPTITFKEAQASKLPNGRYLTLGQLCKEMGGKWHE